MINYHHINLVMIIILSRRLVAAPGQCPVWRPSRHRSPRRPWHGSVPRRHPGGAADGHGGLRAGLVTRQVAVPAWEFSTVIYFLVGEQYGRYIWVSWFMYIYTYYYIFIYIYISFLKTHQDPVSVDINLPLLWYFFKTNLAKYGAPPCSDSGSQLSIMAGKSPKEMGGLSISMFAYQRAKPWSGSVTVTT